jgi:hypothetical protein
MGDPGAGHVVCHGLVHTTIGWGLRARGLLARVGHHAAELCASVPQLSDKELSAGKVDDWSSQ